MVTPARLCVRLARLLGVAVWGRVATLLVLSMAAPRGTLPLSAQVNPAESGLIGVLDRLEPGTRIRVSTQEITTEGLLLGVDGSHIVLDAETGSLGLELTSTDSLWVGGPARAKGALIGAGIGVGLVAISCGSTMDECGLDVGLGIITPMLALLGLGIGSSFNAWSLLNPRPTTR